MRLVKTLLLCAFIAICSSVAFASGAPVLISYPDSTRAIALEAQSFKAEPIPPVENTRLILFATFPFNPENVTAYAQDETFRYYELEVEKVSKVDSIPRLWQVNLKFLNTIQREGDFLFRISLDGIGSNRVRVGIGKVGGGLPDDFDSQPTPFTGQQCKPTQIVFDGDSLTRGESATIGINDYPTQVMQLLGCNYVHYNFGVNGQTLADMERDAGEQIDSLIRLDVRNILIVWGGTNEFANYSNFTSQEAHEHLVTYCKARRKAGWTVVVLTMIPRSDSFIDHNVEPDRVLFNNLMRTDWRNYAAVLVDVGADQTIGQFGEQLNPLFYASDHVHLFPTGYAIVADYVKDAIYSLP